MRGPCHPRSRGVGRALISVEALTAQFEEERPRLRAVAYRLLGSVSDADDAVQETWLRLMRTDRGDVENLPGWLTVVVSRVSLNKLRARANRRESSLDARPPDVIVGPPDETDPEREALLSDSTSLALFVVLETLTPPERLAFVLHDVFAVPFDDIAEALERTPESARQLASRARRRVRGAAPEPDEALPAQREVVDAFFAAARSGDFEALVRVLDPDITLRVDLGPGRGEPLRTDGASGVAGRALMFAGGGRTPHSATVDGAAGVVLTEEGRPVAIMGFTVVRKKVAAIDVVADRDRIAELDLSFLPAT